MTTLHIDLETRSTIDLKQTGVYPYAEHPTTDVWCAAYAVDDGPVHIWTPEQPCPQAIKDAVANGHLIYAHNANFERILWRGILGPRYGWPEPALEQWRCTMAMAYAMSLPGTLEGAGAAAGLEVEKDAVGRRLMLQMAKPRRYANDTAQAEAELLQAHAAKARGEGRIEDADRYSDMARERLADSVVWWDDADRKMRLFDYCRTDVEVERQLGKRLLALRPQEQAIWQLDQRINDRGVYIDVELCEAALQVVKDTTKRLDKEMKAATGGRVGRCSMAQALKEWLCDRGVEAKGVAKDELQRLLLRDDLPDDCRKALELRQEAAKTSTAKIQKMLDMRCADGRVRGNLQYHGAGTGRWAARGVQLQNLPRPEAKDVEGAIKLLRTGNADLMAMVYDKPLSVVSDCIRGMIAAPDGHRIMAADFSAIEARVIAWLAGQRNIVEAFERNEDVYCVTASDIYARPITKKDNPDERQIGKVAVLALGYQGGVGAFMAMAKGYGLDLLPAAGPVRDSASETNIAKAEAAWDERGKKSGLSETRWVTAELIKLAWRDANPAIVQLWRDIEDAAIAAVQEPGTTHKVGPLAYKVAGSFLWCRLPSGRTLCYPYPRLSEVETPWGAMKTTVVYKSVNGVTRQWEEKAFYGGLGAENVTQAIARDLMAEAMVRVDAAGYPCILTVHDEVVCEVPEGQGSLDEFVDLMHVVPDWAAGLPLAAEAWEGPRYRK